MTSNVKAKRVTYKSDLALYFIVAAQIFFWTFSKEYRPDLAIVPPVPSKEAVKAISLGDEQFYFRTLAFELQNAGDTFGRFTALREYNYPKLYQWFTMLDTLDNKSHFVPSLAGYYFSQTQNTPDVIYVINYLREHAERDMYHKWWWMAQAVYLANHKLKDKEMALQLAYKLAATPRDDIPLWVKQMPAFILEKMGEEQQALIIIQDILKNAENIDPGELNFMIYFIKDRLQTIMDKHPELKKLIEAQRARTQANAQEESKEGQGD